MNKTQILLILLCFFQAHCDYVDYYWRHYKDGAIPEDAVPGVKDANGKDTYIGQAYVHNFGLYVAEIVPGVTTVKVANGGVKSTNDDIRILCSKHKENFSWLNTTAATLPRDAVGRHVVLGGEKFVKGDEGTFNIGRVMFDGLNRLGRVDAYKLNEAHLHFVYGDEEKTADNYQVFVYNEYPEDSLNYL